MAAAAVPPKTTDEILLQRGITKELQRAIRQRIREHHLFDDRQVINAAGYLDVRNDTVRKILSPEELSRFTRPDAQVDQRTVCQLIQRIMYEEKGGSMILRAAETTKAEAAENTSRGPSTAMSAKVARDQFAVANTESSDMAGFRQTALVPKNAQINIKAVNDVAAERQAKPKPAPAPAPPPPQHFEDTTQALPSDSADILRKLGFALEAPAAAAADAPPPAPPADETAPPAATATASTEDVNKRMEDIHPWQSLPDDFDDAPPPAAPMEDGEVLASGTTATAAAVPMDVTPAPAAPPSIAPPTIKCKPCGQEVNKLVVACPECKRETCESCVKKLVQSCTSCDTKRCLGCWTDPKKPGLNDDGQCTVCSAKDNSEDQEEDDEEERECVCLDEECACSNCNGSGIEEECDECECCQVAESMREVIRVQRDLGYNPNNRGLINSMRQEAKDLYNKFKKEKDERKQLLKEVEKKAVIARAKASLAKMKTDSPAAAAAAVPPPSPSKSKAAATAAPPPPSPAKSKPSGNKPSSNKPIVSIVIDKSIVKPPPSPPSNDDSDKIELAPVEGEEESSGSDAIVTGMCYCAQLHCPCTNCTTGEDAKKHLGRDIELEECGECGCCKVLAMGEKLVEARNQRVKAEKKCDTEGRKRATELIKKLKEKRAKLCAELLDKKEQAEKDRQKKKDEEEAERLQAEIDREEAAKKKAAKKEKEIQKKKDAEEAERLQAEEDDKAAKKKAPAPPAPSSTAKAQDKKPVQAKSSSADQDMADDDDDDSAPPPPPSLSAEDQRKLKEQHERQVAAAKPKAPRRKKSNALDREFAEADEAARADAKRLGSKYDPLKELEDVRRAIVVDKTKKSKDKDRRKKMDELLKKKAEEDDDEDDDEDYGSGEDIGSGSEEEEDEEESTGTGGGDDDKEGDSDEEEEEEEEEEASAKRKSAASSSSSSSSSPSTKKARVEENHKHKHRDSDSEDDEEEEEDEESDAVSTDDSDRSPSPAPEPRRKSVRFAAQAARESIKDQDAREEQERQDTRDSAEEEKYLLRAFRLAVEHCLDEKKSTLRHICNPNLPLSKFSQDELLSRLSFLYTVHRVYVDDPEKRAQKSNFLDRLALAYLARVKEIGTNKNLIWALEQLLNPATTFSTHKLTELPDAPKDFWTDQKLAKMGQTCPIGGDAVKLDSVATTRLVKITTQENGKPRVVSVLMSSRSSAMLSRFYWACHIQDKIEEAVTAQQQSKPSMDVPNLINWICKNVGRFFVENWQKAKADLIRLIPRDVYERIRDANKHEWQAVLQKKRQ